MLKIEHDQEAGELIPFFECDVCGDPVTITGLDKATDDKGLSGRYQGMAVFDMYRGTVNCKHVHVGRCWRTYEAQVERDYGQDAANSLGTNGLRSHVYFLIKSAGLTLKMLRDEEKWGSRLAAGG